VRLPAPCGTIDGESTPCATGAYCDAGVLSGTACTGRANKRDGDACTGSPLTLECGGDNGHCDATTHTCLACAP